MESEAFDLKSNDDRGSTELEGLMTPSAASHSSVLAARRWVRGQADWLDPAPSFQWIPIGIVVWLVTRSLPGLGSTYPNATMDAGPERITEVLRERPRGQADQAQVAHLSTPVEN